jgi:hypothetical protein
MHYQSLILALTALAFSTTVAKAEVPVNVRCALSAQEKARGKGPEYRQTYNRNFELCMLNAMPREQQTTYLIEKLRPYVAISPGQEIAAAAPKSAGTWVRVSPHVWVLE